MATTRDYSDPAQVVKDYRLRWQIEERYKQIKDSWLNQGFKSTDFNLVVAHIIFTLLVYSLIQVYLNIKKLNNFIITGDSQSINIEEGKVIADALNNPIKSKKLSEIANGKKDAVVLVSDITRPCPSYKFSPYIVNELKAGGINNIKVIFGVGIHRKHTEAEKIKLAGNYVAKNADLIDSNPFRCKLIGKTSYGTPVEVFEEALDTDILVATGNIEYHYFAGYSGGAKAVMPGICSYSSISANHSMMLDGRAVAGSYKDNPVRCDIEEAGKILGIDFIFNVILDDRKNIIAAVSGKNNTAFLEGIKLYDSIYKKEVKDTADIVITSPGGYPKDINLYQSHKALENVKEVVSCGGKIILIAKCSEGFGEDTFASWMADVANYQLLSKKIREKFVLGGHGAVAISKILSKTDVLLYSDFDRNTTESIGFKKLDNIQKYLDSQISKNSSIKITIVLTGRFVRLKNK